MPIWRGNTYRFTVTAATAAAGDTYTNNGQTFTVTDAITAGTVLFCTGTGAPTASGNLVRTSGAGTNPIVFSAVTAPNTNWGTSTNWLTDGSGAGVPTALTDAVFDNVSQNCTVNVAGLCRTLNFNSGTGYVNTITMTNSILVGSTTAATAASVTLGASMLIGGSGAINTRSNTSVTLTSNGRQWPNNFGIGTTGVGIACTVTFVGNWIIDGTLTIGSGFAMQFTFVASAVTITCNGNLFTNVVGPQTTNAIRTVAGSIPTLVLAGNSSWTSSQPISIGINININSPGNTVTIGNNCSYGGNGTAVGSTFTYTAGTVVTSGTFHLMFHPAAASYTVNFSGSNSTSATTTNTSGVNFDNLSLRTSAQNNPQSCTLSSAICVVNDFSITTWSAGTKNIANLLSNNAYLNGDVTINGYSITGTTTFRLQGTGNWSETDTLTAGVTGFGLSNPIVITGAITLTSVVGIYFGSITYTSGSFVLTGHGLRVLGSTLAGFGSAGIIIPTLYHTTASAGAGSRIIITDTVPLQITNLTFDGFNTNRSFSYAGNTGFIVNNFNYQQTAAVGANATQVGLANSITYLVLNSFIFNAINANTPSMVMQTNNGSTPDAIFTLAFGASQDVFGMGGQQINSSAGQTIWSRKGLLTGTTNWQNWTYPKTRFSSFTS